MKKFTIYAPHVDGAVAFNMAFALFSNFTVARAFGLAGGEVKKFAQVTIFAPAAQSPDVIQLRDKFTARSSETATATQEDVTVL